MLTWVGWPNGLRWWLASICESVWPGLYVVRVSFLSSAAPSSKTVKQNIQEIEETRPTPASCCCCCCCCLFICLFIYFLFHKCPYHHGLCWRLDCFLSQGGIYVFQLFDSQSGGVSLVCVCVVETVVIGWGYGKFSLSLETYPHCTAPDNTAASDCYWVDTVTCLMCWCHAWVLIRWVFDCLFIRLSVMFVCLFVRLRKLASHLAILFVICCCFCWCFLSSFFLVNSLLVWLPYAFSLYCFLRLFSSVCCCCCCCCCVYRFSCCYSAAVGVFRVLSAWLSFGSCCLLLVSVVLLHVMSCSHCVCLCLYYPYCVFPSVLYEIILIFLLHVWA